MVNDSSAAEQPLEKTLQETKQALLRSQARLHSLQESVVCEDAVAQLREQYLRSQYELWMMKACMAWIQGDLLKLTQCLEASLDCTPLTAEEIIEDWKQHLEHCRKEIQPVFGERVSRSALSLELLLATSEWQALVKQVAANVS